MASPEVTMYHYTDSQGLAGILSSGRIRQTCGISGRKGVFFTRLDPSTNNQEDLARNNYNTGYLRNILKVTCYVKVCLPFSEFKKILILGAGMSSWWKAETWSWMVAAGGLDVWIILDHWSDLALCKIEWHPLFIIEWNHFSFMT